MSPDLTAKHCYICVRQGAVDSQPRDSHRSFYNHIFLVCVFPRDAIDGRDQLYRLLQSKLGRVPRCEYRTLRGDNSRSFNIDV
jgi:hypothetical protein